jgi:hypothetical protein
MARRRFFGAVSNHGRPAGVRRPTARIPAPLTRSDIHRFACKGGNVHCEAARCIHSMGSEE